MSVNLPIRTLVPRNLSRRSAVVALRGYSPQIRHASDDSKNSSNPLLDQFREREAQRNAEEPTQERPKAGDLAPSSIFEDERRERKLKQAKEGSTDATDVEKRYVRDPEIMARVLDPNPVERERWERRKVIQMMRRNGRMTRAEIIARQEREHLVKTPNLKTSVKKLGMLARQIAGKSVEEAELQMRFSKKKAAKEILEHLEAAKNEAVVSKGMGIGEFDENGDKIDDFKRVDIQLKNGKRYKVTDPSKMYIAQAWVGRGPYGKLLEYRARGRVNIQRTPWTSISFLLKEEKTRIREWQDREAKRQRLRKEQLWQHLPDTKISGPRGQYFTW